jgi:hypothetical protein
LNQLAISTVKKQGFREELSTLEKAYSEAAKVASAAQLKEVLC